MGTSNRTSMWLAAHALAVVLPVLGAVAGAPDVSLFGSEARPERPPLSLASWREERAQTGLQAWFEAHIGFRGAMVRTDNSLQAFVVGEAKPSVDVVIGREDTLFIKDDLWYMARRKRDVPPVLARVDQLAAHVGSAQRKLAARGSRLIVVISPSKTAVYPEAVPEGWRRTGVRSDVEIHRALRSALERSGVAFADAHTVLDEKHGEERELFFGRRGRHWTELTACLVLRNGMAGDPDAPSCAYEMRISDRNAKETADFDLYRLLNLWRFERGGALVPRIKPEGALAAATRRGPRALFVGTSFIWPLVDLLRPHVEAPIVFYYNTTVYDASEGARAIEPVDAESPRWPGYVLERDLIVLEIQETYAYGDALFDFVETLDRRLP